MEETQETPTGQEVEETQEQPTGAEVSTPETGEEPPEQPEKVEAPKTVPVSALMAERSKRQQWEQDAEYWRIKALERERQPEPPKQEQPTAPPQAPGLPPDRYDYDSTEQYQQAVGQWQAQNVEYTRHLVREEQRQSQEATKQQTAQAKQQEAQQQTAKKLAEIADKGAKKYEDFREVAFVPEIAAAAVSRCENADEIAYFWGKNPDKMQSFLDMANADPAGALYELGKLDVSLSKKPKKPTSAPPPVTPVSGTAPAGAEPDPAKDPEGWLKWERNRVKALGRRY